jgi:quercetin dioxygenase-like cupin family protein
MLSGADEPIGPLALNNGSRGGLLWRALALGLALSLGTGAVAEAQPTAVHKTTLQQQAFPAPPLHTVMVKATVDVGGEVTPHTHPGLEMAYVVEGQAEVTLKGHKPLPLSAGGSFAIPPGTVHSVKNVGRSPLILVSTYVVDQTEPIVIPAP